MFRTGIDKSVISEFRLFSSGVCRFENFKPTRDSQTNDYKLLETTFTTNSQLDEILLAWEENQIF